MNNTYINQYIDNIDVFSQDISMDNKGRITIPKGFPFNVGDKIFVKYNKNERFFKLISLDLKLKQLLNIATTFISPIIIISYLLIFFKLIVYFLNK